MIIASEGALNAQESAGSEKVLFSEDFENGQVSGLGYKKSDWEIISDDLTSSKVWTSVSEGQAYASNGAVSWSDYTLQLQARRVAGSFNIYFRVNGNNDYAVRIESDRIVLWTEHNSLPQELTKADLKMGNDWHDYMITALGNQITVSVDGAEILIYLDNDKPLSSGGIGLEILSKGGALFDNLLVKTISQVNSSANGSEAATDWVQTNGPMGGAINTIEIDPMNPKMIYAGGIGGIYKSEDSGTSWNHLEGFLSSYGTVRTILLDPYSTNILYADSGTLFKSNDSGGTWVPIFNGLVINCVAIDPENTHHLLLGNDQGQVWLSMDGGINWQNVSSDLPGYKIKAVAFGSGDELWVGTGFLNGKGNGFLYHRAKNSTNWSKVDLQQADSSEIHTVYVEPQNMSIVYVGLNDIHNEMFSPKGDIYLVKTGDDGSTWEKLRLPFTDAMVNVMGFDSQSSTIYVGTGGRTFASNNDGKNWMDISPGGRNGDMYDIAVDPRFPNTLYLPRRGFGIVKSVDGGKKWDPVNNGLLNTTVSLIALGDSTGSTIYATSTGGEGTYKSTDFGNTWINVTAGGITHPWADELTVVPTDPQTIWEIADVGELYVSKSGGQTWKKTVDPYGNGFRAGTISAVAIAPSNAYFVYALKSGFGIFKSLDRMNSWSFLHQSEVDYSYSMAVNPNNSSIIFSGDIPKPFQTRARVQRSIDGGETWSTSLTIPNSGGVTSVAIDPQKPQQIYASSIGASINGGGQLYHSSDNGDTWSRLNPHFTMLTVWGQPQLIGDPNNPSIIYASTWLAGTWKSVDAGRSWMKLRNAPISSTSLSIDPTNTNLVYATDRTSPKLWQSRDGGSTWVTIADFSSDGAFLLNRVLTDGSSIYVSTFGPSIHAGKLYRSTDQGSTWTDITHGLPRSVLDIAINPSDTKTLFVTTHIFGAYKSTDGGTTWSELSNFPDIGAYDIEIDPMSPNILYAAGLGGSVPNWVLPGGHTFENSAGVYKSTDGGNSWQQILVTSNECRAVRMDPTNHNLLFVSSLSDGFFVSNDGGMTWKSNNNGLDSKNLTSVWVGGNKVYVGTQGFGVYSGNLNLGTGAVVWIADRSNKPVPDVYSLQIQVDPTDSNKIYVGSNPGGLYRSDDGGKTWFDKNFLTPSVVVDDPFRQGYYTFAINPANTDEVWVGTWGKGIYKSYDGQDFNIGANGADRIMLGKHINALLFHPDLGVIVATEEGVFYSKDGGISWTDWSEGLGSLQVRTLNQFSDGTILCGTTGYELYQRRPAESNWHQVKALGNFGTFWPIWNNRPLYQYSQLLFQPTDPNTIYFGTFPEGIFKSTDEGKTWKESNVGWTTDGVFTLVFHPSNTKIIYAGTYNGVNRSLDAGSHWEKWNAGWPEQQWVFSIDFDPGNPNIMYACSKNGENEGTGRPGFHGTVMKSTDGGANWFAITNGLDLNDEFYKIIVDKFDPNTVYLATQHDGVQISQDGGKSWSAFNDGLTNLVAGTNGNNVTNTMVLSENGRVLYFGSAGSGVFRRYLANP
jgi:photosystem II stability/assembly factor-like uncharacterized protein